MERWKSRGGKSQGGEDKEMEKIKEGENQKREDAGARKGKKVAIHCVFPMICGSGVPKTNLAKAAGAEPSGQMRDEKVHAVVARSIFASQKWQNPTVSDTFGSCDVEKVHTVMARSTFASQKWQKPTVSDHFWKLRCRKSARRCGAKHICKSKCTKHTELGPLLEVQMSKKCTPLWCEAHFQVKCTKHTMLGPLLEVEMSKKCTALWREPHFQVKSVKSCRFRTIFWRSDVEKVHAIVARSICPSQKCKKLRFRSTF